MNRDGLRWRDGPKNYGPYKTPYNRWQRWGRMGVFARMMEGLATPQSSEHKAVTIGVT